MKLVSALVALAALGGVALTSADASATPIDVPAASTVVPAGYVCNEWGHCWHRHYGGGYTRPYRWGGYGWNGGWHHRWHHWHRPWGYGGGWGWHHRHWGGGWGWHHWHHYW